MISKRTVNVNRGGGGGGDGGGGGGRTAECPSYGRKDREKEEKTKGRLNMI